ncbi:MAG: hypothetical protein AABY33_02095 [Pseudomonadota bacterium]
MKSTKVTSCIICDIARKESGGKDILIGVYSNYMKINPLPAVLPNFAVWMELQTEETKFDSLEISILDPDNKTLINAKGKLEITSETSYVGIPMQFSNMPFPKAGKYKIQIGIDGPMKTVKEFFVLGNVKSEAKKRAKKITAKK